MSRTIFGPNGSRRARATIPSIREHCASAALHSIRSHCASAALHVALLAFASGCSLFGGSAGGIHARMGYSETGGLRVVEAPPDGPAARAGLQEDDLITFIDGDPVSEMDMSEVVERLRGPVGSRVTLAVVRDGEELEIEVERRPYERE